MIYILRQSGDIIGFRETPWGLSVNQTQEEVDTTMSDYEGRCKLSVDKEIIVADGLDEAHVTVTSNTSVPSINLLVDGDSYPVTMTNGVGTLVITSEAPGVISVGVADTTIFTQAGYGSLTIRVM